MTKTELDTMMTGVRNIVSDNTTALLEKITDLEKRLKANEDALNKWLATEIPHTEPPINTGPAGSYGTAKDYC